MPDSPLARRRHRLVLLAAVASMAAGPGGTAAQRHHDEVSEIAYRRLHPQWRTHSEIGRMDDEAMRTRAAEIARDLAADLRDPSLRPSEKYLPLEALQELGPLAAGVSDTLVAVLHDHDADTTYGIPYFCTVTKAMAAVAPRDPKVIAALASALAQDRSVGGVCHTCGCALDALAVSGPAAASVAGPVLDRMARGRLLTTYNDQLAKAVEAIGAAPAMVPSLLSRAADEQVLPDDRAASLHAGPELRRPGRERPGRIPRERGAAPVQRGRGPPRGGRRRAGSGRPARAGRARARARRRALQGQGDGGAVARAPGPGGRSRAWAADRRPRSLPGHGRGGGGGPGRDRRRRPRRGGRARPHCPQPPPAVVRGHRARHREGRRGPGARDVDGGVRARARRRRVRPPRSPPAGRRRGLRPPGGPDQGARPRRRVHAVRAGHDHGRRHADRGQRAQRVLLRPRRPAGRRRPARVPLPGDDAEPVLRDRALGGPRDVQHVLPVATGAAFDVEVTRVCEPVIWTVFRGSGIWSPIRLELYCR